MRAVGWLAAALGVLSSSPAFGAPPPPCDRGPNVLDVWLGVDVRRHPTFSRPTLIAVDPAGSVYLLDQNNYVVQQLSSDGHFVRTWELPGDDFAIFMVAMAASDSFLYVSDGSSTFQFFEDGSVATWNFGSCENGLAVDKEGNVFLAASRGRFSHTLLLPETARVRKPPIVRKQVDVLLDKDRVGIWKLSSQGEVLDHWDAPSWPITIGKDGTLYAVEPDSGGKILCIDAKGVTTQDCKIGLERTVALRNIAVSSEGHLFVNDFNTVVEANLQGKVLRRWCDFGPGRDPLDRPGGLAVDNQGHLYVAEGSKSRVIKLDLHEK